MPEKKEIPWEKITLPFKDDEEFTMAWEQFLVMRKKIRKPATDYAQYLQLMKIQKNGWAKEKAIASIEQSIMKSWQDLYEPQGFSDAPKFIGGVY